MALAGIVGGSMADVKANIEQAYSAFKVDPDEAACLTLEQVTYVHVIYDSED